jgi:AcrR family transcriptional regulator
VLETAVALADRAGIEGLTMRSLAQELGVVPMALYKHVSNKDEMLDGMVDIIFGEIDLPPADTDWKSAMRRRAVSARQVLARHRWAIGMTESRMRPGPLNLRHHESVLGFLREAGFSIEMAIHAYSTIDSYIYGFALEAQQLPFEGAEEAEQVAELMLEQLPQDEFPYLRETILQHITKKGWQYANEFEFGLDLILDGLDRLRLPDQT